MSLRNIILGLTGEPTSGYDIKARLEESLQHFWAAELSQIYPVLRGLEADGLVTSKTVPSAKGPARKVYRRTKRGTKALVHWFSEGPQLQDERRHYLAQVFFLYNANDPGLALDFFAQLREAMGRKLDSLLQVEKTWRESDPRYPDRLPDSDFFPQMTLELGLRVFDANIRWCDECIARLKKRRRLAVKTRVAGS